MIKKSRFKITPKSGDWKNSESNAYLYKLLNKRYSVKVDSNINWNLYNLVPETNIWSYGLGEGEEDYFNLHIASGDMKNISFMVLNYKSQNFDPLVAEYINEIKQIIDKYNLELVALEDEL